MTGKYDLVVVGGGISGSIAAIAAARMGVDTLLIEQYGFLGGSLTANGVGPMMTFHAGDEQVVQGITGEMIDRLVKKGKSPGHIFDTTGYTYSVTPFDAEAMKHELEIMLLEAGGKILYHTMLAAVTTQDDKIISITVCNKDGLSEINGELFIDATGDGDLASRAGVPYQKGRKKDGQNQPMTMNLKMGNVDIARVRAYIKEHPEEFPRLNNDTSIIDRANRLSIGGFVRTLEKAKKEGSITFEREDILFFETNNPGEVIINVTRILNHDATDAGSLSEAEIEGRRQVRELEAFMKERIPGFENAVRRMKLNETKKITIAPEEAYGEAKPEMIQTIGKDQLPPEMEVEVGQQLASQMPDGQQIVVTVTDVKENEITIDANHPLAGKTLNFDIEVVKIEG